MHQIHDMYAMPAPKFFAFAERMAAYRGVMRMRAEQQQSGRPGRAGGRSSSSSSGDQVTYYSDVSQNPELGALFGRRRDNSRGRAGGRDGAR